jgi:hypothetical protein
MIDILAAKHPRQLSCPPTLPPRSANCGAVPHRSPIAFGQVQFVLVALLSCALFTQGLVSERLFGVSRATSSIGDSLLSRLLIEFLACANVVWLILYKKLHLPNGWPWFILFFTWALLCGPLGGTGSFYEGFLYGRYTLYAFGLYLCAWNHPFTPRQLRALGYLITALFTAQVASSIITGVVWGERLEWRVGTMTVGGGELAALFPILALGYAMGWYFYVDRSAWVLLMALSFSLVGYASGKRATYFLFPLFVCFNAICYRCLCKQRRPELFAARQCLVAVVCIGACVIGGIYGMNQSVGIDRALTKSEGGLDMFGTITRYIADYEMGSTAGLATGRASASTVAIQEVAAEGMARALFGLGPGAFLQKSGNAVGGGFAPFGIAYGIVGCVHATIAVGLLGALFYFAAYFSVLVQVYKVITQGRLAPQRATVALGTLSGCVLVLYAFLGYGSVFMFSGWVTFPLLFFAGVVGSTTSKYTMQAQRSLPSSRPLPGDYRHQQFRPL